MSSSRRELDGHCEGDVDELAFDSDGLVLDAADSAHGSFFETWSGDGNDAGVDDVAIGIDDELDADGGGLAGVLEFLGVKFVEGGDESRSGGLV